MGRTPITLELERGTEYELRLRLGEKETLVTLSSGIDNAFLALDIAPGLVVAGLSAVTLATTPDPRRGESRTDIPLSPAVVNRLVRDGAVIGIAVGLGWAAINVAVDASTGRWYRLTPSEVLIVFD